MQHTHTPTSKGLKLNLKAEDLESVAWNPSHCNDAEEEFLGPVVNFHPTIITI